MKARQRHPEWPLAWLGEGLSEAGKGDWLAAEPLNIGTRVGPRRPIAPLFVH